MNSSHRDGAGWPPGHGANPQHHQRERERERDRERERERDSQAAGFGPHSGAQPSPHNAPRSLPPPSASPYAPYHQPAHGLGGLSSLNQPSSRHPQQPQSGLPQPFGVPGLGQQQSMQSRELAESRERDPRDVHIKEEQDAAVRRDQQRDRERERERERERDMQRQHMDHLGPHQPQPAHIHLHQPVAVGPRTVHGPNGLLGNPSAIGAPSPHSHLPPPAPPAAVFSGGAVQPPAQPAQSSQAGMLLPFGPNSQGQNGNVGQGQQPILNDALSYLDQVKVQFADHPDVYNRFLDIMKDFKSGAIDTPGVIERVSSLFAGNPELIQGFNTFLPPGYRIECGTGDDPNAIRVTTPMGTTVSTMPVPQRPLSNPRAPPQSSQEAGPDGNFGRFRPNEGSYTPGQHQPPPAMLSPASRHAAPPGFAAQIAQQHQQQQLEAQQREQQALAHQQEQRNVSQLQSAVSAAASDALPRQALMSPSGASPASMPGQEMAIGPDGQPLGPGMEKRGPVEFNHAISYVNKIKNRFSAQPDIYKQFLEILQTYQRESKPIQDVYGQVTRLFHSAPDLLEDFKQFLPESAAHAKAAAAARQQQDDAVMMSNVRNEPFYTPTAQPHQTPRTEHRLPPVGNFAPTPTVNKDNKRKRGERQGTVASSAMPEPNGTGAAAAAAAAAANAAATAASKGGNAYGQVANANKRAKQAHGGKGIAGDVVPLSPTLVPALPEPLPPTSTINPTSDELAFFDRAKKVIGNKNTMNEFLKLCNLFSQDLIDRATLVYKARSFIGGNPDLFGWFQQWVGHEEKDVAIENKPRIPTGRVSLSNCRALGPSYRLLPQRERLKPCRGRDELCNEVLNDEWASHPTWASEDSGFIAHRKNIHEEGLHKIEEERHDYDFNIEACSRTIQLLEPIAQQLLRMTPREQETMEIPPGLGGQSETIHKRIIMKLYGREKGMEVVKQLHSKPYAVVPILLNRLKQKQEEWKQAQREWEKVWREQTQKMFWKSLDHQAVNAKQADKRQFQTKVLVGEIQTKYEEQKRLRLAQQGNLILGPQLKYKLEESGVVLDASHLVLLYAERYHSTDHPRLTSFIREFIPLFFGLDNEWFNAQIKNRAGDSPQHETPEDGMSAFDDPITSKPRKAPGKKDGLLRGVLDRGRKSRKDDGSQTPVSRASTPDNASRADEDMADGINSMEDVKSDAAIDIWTQHPLHGNIFQDSDVLLTQAYKRDVFNLYGNTEIYCFLRIFTFLYERLSNLKHSEVEVHKTVKRALKPKPAIELGIVDKLPTDFFSDTGEDANYYKQMLNMFEDLIRDEMEMVHIEEALRRYYLQTGWQLYSLDKLLSALVRFAINMISSEGKNRSWDILQLFKKDRQKEETTFQDESSYRKQVEKYTKDGDIFKISYDQKLCELAVQVFKKEDPTFETFKLLEADRWRVYVSQYIRLPSTEDVRLTKRPYLSANLRPLMEPNLDNTEDRTDEWLRRYEQGTYDDKLVLRISVQQYKLMFERNTEEYYYQPLAVRENGKEGAEEAEATVSYRAEQLQDTLLINNSAMRGLSKEDVEGKNEAFAQLVKDGPGNDAGDDSEMEG
ncbi:hypothetical protein AAFC00_000168 [Neodothiora populina]|uniref:Histone deacetylase interacting domain-containing protein n=1 Tax=Neodothiora populina TaxID=2781224 RepID=A0ABR3P2F0_9PEZI